MDRMFRAAVEALKRGFSREQFLQEQPAEGQTYDRALAYLDEICADHGSTFEGGKGVATP